ncbi:MAG: hypothetical protein KJ052_07885 [Candidatus Hydrogenedentes bacterium]|nr:hypothetical protein [Candidatus Hydrogenedentota bacterium]
MANVFRYILPLLCIVFACAAMADSVGDRVAALGNADTDEERLALLRAWLDEGIAEPQLGVDAERLAGEIERWLTDPRLDYFGGPVLKENRYDFGIAENSPLYPITELYQARMRLWVTLEYGGFWKNGAIRRERFDTVRPMFETLREQFPGNVLVRMYLGEPIPPAKELSHPADAPAWAVSQREALERLTDIITWWIDHRQQPDGQYGGGWGDDCEMWRWWTPVLLGFREPRLNAAQARFSRALWNLPHMEHGYTSQMSDVEHTAEDSADALTPMMHLEPANPEWSQRAMRLAELMGELWTGTNERGFLQYKSINFTVDKIDDNPRIACDTVYHPRTVQPALLYWQRTGDEALGELFTAWMDTWVDATARAENGKPAGVIPSGIHWPDGGIGGLGANWWDPRDGANDPLYVWPSAMSMMTNTLLLAYHMTSDEKYLMPLRSMAEIRWAYVSNPPEEAPAPGTAAWCGRNMRGLEDALAKLKLLTGSNESDALLAKSGGAYMQYRLNGDETALAQSLKGCADALRINFPGYTSEVRYTDRVLRFPTIFAGNSMYEHAIEGIHSPDPALLYSTATGDPGDGLYFPANAVRWLTPPRDIAVLVEKATGDGFEARLYHFGEEPRAMAAEFYLLGQGSYQLHAGDEVKTFEVDAETVRLDFTIPPRRVCAFKIEKSG